MLAVIIFYSYQGKEEGGKGETYRRFPLPVFFANIYYIKKQMSTTHTYNIDKLKKNFENMVAIIKEISRTKSKITEKLTNLKAIYTDLSKTKATYLNTSGKLD